jgi:hypothetical protein
METFVVRAAQAAFHRAGYSREESLSRAQSLVASLLANPNGYQAEYGTSDQLELAYQMARRMAVQRP